MFQVQPHDSDGDGAEGGDRVDSFLRYFGDSDGDRAVDAADFALLDRAFGTVVGDLPSAGL